MEVRPPSPMQLPELLTPMPAQQSFPPRPLPPDVEAALEHYGDEESDPADFEVGIGYLFFLYVLVALIVSLSLVETFRSEVAGAIGAGLVSIVFWIVILSRFDRKLNEIRRQTRRKK